MLSKNDKKILHDNLILAYKGALNLDDYQMFTLKLLGFNWNNCTLSDTDMLNQFPQGLEAGLFLEGVRCYILCRYKDKVGWIKDKVLKEAGVNYD